MNKNWKVCLIGLGSIGKRHIHNLSTLIKKSGDSLTLDLVRSNKGSSSNDMDFDVRYIFSYDDDLSELYDIIFVTNPTFMHYQTIRKYQWNTKSMFIEKPLFSDIKENIFEINKNCIFYIACPIRYKKVIQYIKNNINRDEILSVISMCSSYLPNWRPKSDYRKCYSAHAIMGGGVSLDLIHEIDYVSFILGKPTDIKNIRCHISDLEIDSDDVSVYLINYKNAISQIYLDYYGKKDIRKLILFTKHDTIFADLLNNTITFLCSDEIIRFDESRDDFQIEELAHFFKILNGEIPNDNNLEHAFETLKNSFGIL